MLSIAIRPRSKGDEDKLMTGLNRLREEDPSLGCRRVDETHQTLLSGTGETHLAVACERLHRKFGVDVDIEDVRVAYRETITKEADAEGKYKKQTGGHGQFGVANVTYRATRTRRGIPLRRPGRRRRHPAPVHTGGRKRRHRGDEHRVASSDIPVVDVEVACYDGKFHSVDSSEMSFKMAGSLAFREAMAKAGPVLLEPISRIEITVPPSMQGDVLGDLNSRRGRVQGTDTLESGDQRITALVPTAEIQRYAIDLRSLTGRAWSLPRGARPLRHRSRQPRRQTREGQSRLKLKLDLHDDLQQGSRHRPGPQRRDGRSRAHQGQPRRDHPRQGHRAS